MGSDRELRAEQARRARQVERGWQRALADRHRVRMSGLEGFRKGFWPPTDYLGIEDVQLLVDMLEEAGCEPSERRFARMIWSVRRREAYAVWEAELADKHREKPMPAEWASMELVPWEEFADAEDLKRWREIKEEHGIPGSGSRGRIPMADVIVMFGFDRARYLEQPRATVMGLDGWESWRGTGPWAGWARPVWRASLDGAPVCLFPDSWQVWEMRSYARQWRGRLVALPLSTSEYWELARRLPAIDEAAERGQQLSIDT